MNWALIYLLGVLIMSLRAAHIAPTLSESQLDIAGWCALLWPAFIVGTIGVITYERWNQ